MIDPAMCRPGRLDKLLYVDLPSADERVEIFKSLSHKLPISHTDDPSNSPDAIHAIVRAERYEGFSGADLAALVREAAVVALRRAILVWNGLPNGVEDHPKVTVLKEDFEAASRKVGPSVSAAQRRKYENLKTKFAGAVATVKLPEDASS